METLNFTVADGIARVTFNRPEALNAFSYQMCDEFWSLAPRLQDSDVRVVVFRGEGRAFSAGADIKEFGRWDGQPTAAFRRDVRRFHDFYDFLEYLEKPVIAAINGACVGGGLEIALSCDIRIARAGAKLGFPENALGLIPNSGGCSRTMRLIGPGLTKVLVMTGELITAEYAREIGLVEYVHPADQFDDAVETMVRKLASKAPQALALAKYVIDNAMETDRHTGRYIERLAQSVLLRTEDHQEGVAAFIAKRPPSFSGR